MKRKVIIPLIILSIFSIINNYYSRYYLSSFNNYYIKTIIWFIVGYLIIFITSKININYILNKGLYLYIFGIILLILTLFIGTNVNGSKSWIGISKLSIQPSEFMKIPLIIYLREITIKDNISDIKYILMSFIITIIPSILVFLEPDTGPIISYIVIFISFLIMKKINKKYYIIGGIITILPLILLTYLYIFNKELFISILGTNIFYRIDRITSFINQEGYQINTALKSISLSKYLGIKKRVYFPEAPTDFAITLLISNFGLIGLIIYLTTYSYFLYQINKQKKDKLIIYPIINTIIVQLCINLLMNVSLFPIIGITFPLLSYGGSSIISYFILISIIYNMDYTYIHHNNYNHKDTQNQDYNYLPD